MVPPEPIAVVFFGPVVKMEIKIPRLNIYSIDTLQHFYTRVEERDTKVR